MGNMVLEKIRPEVLGRYVARRTRQTTRFADKMGLDSDIAGMNYVRGFKRQEQKLIHPKYGLGGDEYKRFHRALGDEHYLINRRGVPQPSAGWKRRMRRKYLK